MTVGAPPCHWSISCVERAAEPDRFVATLRTTGVDVRVDLVRGKRDHAVAFSGVRSPAFQHLAPQIAAWVDAHAADLDVCLVAC